MLIKIKTLDSGIRGLILLPAEFDPSPPNELTDFISTDDKLSIHMFCMNNLTSDDLELPVFAHMMNVKGIQMPSDIISKELLIFVTLCAYFIATAENTQIIPFYDVLFPNYPKDEANELNLTMRAYFKHLFESFIVFFNKTEYAEHPVELDIQNILNQMSEEEKKNNEYIFEFKCIHCDHLDYNSFNGNPSLDEKLNSKYRTSSLKFCVQKNSQLENDNEEFKLNTQFIQNFRDIRYLGIVNQKLIIEDENCLSKSKLTALQLENNQLGKLPASLFDVKSLQRLWITNNPIRTFLEDDENSKSKSNSKLKNLFKNLENLKSIIFENLLIDDKSVFKNPPKNKEDLIRLPKSLKSLKLVGLSLSYLPFDLSKTKFELNELVFSGVKWLDLSHFNSSQVSVNQETVSSLLKRFFKNSELSKLFQYFDSNSKGFLNREDVLRLNAYVFKSFARLSASCEPNDTLGGIPAQIFELTQLTLLDLSYQAIKFLPDEISNLVSLTSLILNDCVLLETISDKLSLLKCLKSLGLNDCYSLKTPPPEICKRGFDSIISYLKRLSAGSVQCKRTKLMLVGLGEAGKTSLLNALMKKSPKRPDLTDGIDISDWKIQLPDQTELTYSMWDFAGQSVYYNTHQFFLSSRAVYLLVWNVRLGAEYAGLDFWLSSISCHAPGAPIFIVGTHIDEVSKYTLNQDKLKSRFRQIVGFYYVSNINHDGIKELVDDLIKITLEQKYIGESIPEVWLNFENEIKTQSHSLSLISYEEISRLALKCGLYEARDMLEAVHFLNDLGALQYFDNNSLKDKVIINPQWIVDVMACVVSVKQSPIKDGKLYSKDIKTIWRLYDESLHAWMLKLTEVFDLTISIPEQQLNIVPCLLPDIEPEFEWPDINEANPLKLKEYKVVYNFVYLPAGLFNRIQVRLYQYSDHGFIWKTGSFLRKNNHLALIIQTEQTIEIKVQGVKPENIIFVIHEVIETLINESFHGTQYDYSFPCPDCVETQSVEPCLFSSTLLRRASDFKAPYLQCHKFFHAVSIQEMLAVMPIESASNLDLNLEYSFRDIKQIKNNLKYDITFWYCEKDCEKEVDPRKVIELLSKEYTVWHSKSPKEEKIDRVTYKLKESKLVILGVSDDFSRDEKCVQVFQLVKNIIRKNYLLVEFGVNGAHEWLKEATFASVCADYRVVMQDQARLKYKIDELLEVIEKQTGDVLVSKETKKNAPDVFISYCWSNSHDAVKKGTKRTETSLGWFDPRSLLDIFSKNNIKAWLDVHEATSSSNLFGEIAKGMNEASVVIACVSDEYVKSKNCTLEFRFAHISLKIPIINLIVGAGNEWKKHEISFLGSNYPEVNLQYENPNGLDYLVKLVREELERNRNTKLEKLKTSEEKLATESKNAALQELYELVQRKFLRQMIKLNDKMMNVNRAGPRLLFLDLIEGATVTQTPNSNANSHRKKVKLIKQKTRDDDEECVDLVQTIRVMCEYEESWHPVSLFVPINELKPSYGSYLARIMNILKHSYLRNELTIFLADEGQKILIEIEKHAFNESKTVEDLEVKIGESYSDLRNYFIDKIEENFRPNENTDVKYDDEKFGGLKRCELKNGKILWLCTSHVKNTDARIISNDLDTNMTNSRNAELNILDALETLKDEKIFDNESKNSKSNEKNNKKK